MTREEQRELMKECMEDGETVLENWWRIEEPSTRTTAILAAAFFQYRAALIDLEIGKMRNKSLKMDKESAAYRLQ